jgi:lipopolysaccharide transport system ATP-binding protein
LFFFYGSDFISFERQKKALRTLFDESLAMSENVIVVDKLSKRYLIGHRYGGAKYTALRDVIGREINNFARKAAAFVRGRQVVQGDQVEEFWALKNVSFEVKQGEVLGIVGRNGAGKSTLLKILSRITEPTEGRVLLRGRVASLLEVGTGFHPELTGRENVFLNGAILGMTQREIRKKFDEIVAFAEVEKFLDTPVKYFSSGMYVRLAFAVASHLEPEILVVDEVLAVGDSEFQKKCLGKMNEVSRQEGRTVLFVSHNLAAVAELTDRALLLSSGTVEVDGTVSDVLSSYLAAGARNSSYVRPPDEKIPYPHIARVEVYTSDPNAIHRFGQPLSVKFWIRHPMPMAAGTFCFGIVNQFQTQVIQSGYYRETKLGDTAGYSVIECHFPRLLLNVGQYYLRTCILEPGHVYEALDGLCVFEVIRIDKAPELFGWRPEACTYHEEHAWKAVDFKSTLEI